MNTYEVRRIGRDYCNTEGSEHYKGGEVEPLDLIFALGYGEGFCAGSIIKYAGRYKRTRNPDDMKKVSDYAHILCGAGLLSAKDGAKKKADILCARRRTSGKDCETCPVGRNAHLDQVGCEEYTKFYPEIAAEMLEGETHGQ